MYGYNGKILLIDLSGEKINEIYLDDYVYRKFLGGYGLGVYFLLKNQKKGIDPLSEESYIGFLPGLLNGTGVPMAGRFMAVGKSPLTGGWNDSNVGGYIGPEIKNAGFDGIFITGKSKDPVYIYVSKSIEILDASKYWGLDAIKTENELEKIHGDGEILTIGQAGENISYISSIITDRGRALGRGGLGAIMGSKNLKAIYVRGYTNVKIYDREKLRTYISKMMEKMNPKKNKIADYWHRYGTTGGNEKSHLSGDTPIKNWKGIGIRDFGKENAKKISGNEVIKDNIRSYGCAQCPVACGAIIRRNTRYGLIEGHRLEYEGLGMLGGLLLNSDLDSIAYSFELANEYGYDVISLGAVIGFAMECYENGILSEKDLGLKLEWGNPDSIVEFIEKMAKNDGIYKILNKGVAYASKFLNAPDEMAVHVHGQELPAHDPKYLPSLATTYVSDPTPGRHTAGGIGFSEGSEYIPFFDIGIEKVNIEKYVYKGKGRYHFISEVQTQVINSLGFCIFADSFSPLPAAEVLNAVTGWDIDANELMIIGERILDSRRLFNYRENVYLKDNILPKRAEGNPPHDEGPLKGITIDWRTMVEEFAKEAKWDLETGLPDRERLKELDLIDFID
ncbi:MAG: aldehyde ferredoxin oxidoreductase family protein [Thermoplasmata archaeon]|jgi:aldehyde:ferredoxin oxidoreductase